MKKILFLLVMSTFVFNLASAYALTDSPLQAATTEESEGNTDSAQPIPQEVPSAVQQDVQAALPSVVAVAASPSVPMVGGKPLKTKEEIVDINVKTLQSKLNNLERRLAGLEQNIRFQDEKIRSMDRKIDDLKRLR